MLSLYTATLHPPPSPPPRTRLPYGNAAGGGSGGLVCLGLYGRGTASTFLGSLLLNWYADASSSTLGTPYYAIAPDSHKQKCTKEVVVLTNSLNKEYTPSLPP
jgi:hypothetical protein